MVTMAVSTVSVIESIVVIRLCTLQATSTPLPPVVRLVAFRLVGRALCVSCPSSKVSPSRSSTRPLGDRGSGAVVNDGAVDIVNHGTALDDVIVELRKVTSLLLVVSNPDF